MLNIRKRIGEYKKEFDISTQKAELLLRNQQFQKELQAVLNWTPYDFLKYKEKLKPLIEFLEENREELSIRTYLEFRKEMLGKHKPRANSDKIISANRCKDVGERDYYEEIEELYINALRGDSGDENGLNDILKKESEWQRFCKNWNIQPDWDGNEVTLPTFLNLPVELIYVEGKKNQTPDLLLRITEWTTLDNIRQVWNTIPEWEKERVVEVARQYPEKSSRQIRKRHKNQLQFMSTVPCGLQIFWNAESIADRLVCPCRNHTTRYRRSF